MRCEHIPQKPQTCQKGNLTPLQKIDEIWIIHNELEPDSMCTSWLQNMNYCDMNSSVELVYFLPRQRSQPLIYLILLLRGAENNSLSLSLNFTLSFTILLRISVCVCVCVCHVPHFYISYIGVGRLVNIFCLSLQFSNLLDKSMFHALESWLLYIRWCQ